MSSTGERISSRRPGSTRTLSITDIAYATGFRSSQYFSLQFRRYFLTTPSRYRGPLSSGLPL
ncbi:MAG: helix-turn-helix domain-containing protein [Bosea sp.]|nr:helix-turn-helix domain-containing protein [Bosea sp. (in: a-proteobacteria)]